MGTPGSSSNRSNSSTPKTRKTNKPDFVKYWEGLKLSQGLKRGMIFRGKMRINAFNRREGYVTLPGVPVDILIKEHSQNRTVEGDEVAIEIFPSDKWGAGPKASSTASMASPSMASTPPSASSMPPDGSCITPAKDIALEADSDVQPTMLDMVQNQLSQASLNGSKASANKSSGSMCSDAASMTPPENSEKATMWRPPQGTPPVPDAALEALAAECNEAGNRPTGRVVALLEESPKRAKIVGQLKCRDDQPHSWSLEPADPRMPRMIVDPIKIPPELLKAHEDGRLGSMLVGARLDRWEVNSWLPFAVVRASMGQAGEIDSETACIAFEYDLPPDDFKIEVLNCLPPTPWIIPDEERAVRRPLQSERIFSIDPKTARDLDDALSIKELPDGRGYEVGVHIADVAHFIPPGSALDQEARMRSTSSYLIQKVVPMLPRLLCEELCSLNPGVERLAFSAIWELTPEGDITKQWYGRSIITSCCKLDYEAAQAIIETEESSEGEEEWKLGEIALHGGFTWDQVAKDVRLLHKLGQVLRKRRFDEGSLRLNNTKIVFAMDEDGNPCKAIPYRTKQSNHLVEEFMLLANRSVAKFISHVFPENALLRRHPPPETRKLEGLRDFCLKYNLDLDTSTAGALNNSLTCLQETMKAEGNHEVAELVTIQVTKPMQLALYFCTAGLDESEWSHYALGFPYYTHFTSPIRRYPDVLVHRLLAAALEAHDAVLRQLPKAPAPNLTHAELKAPQALWKQASSKAIEDHGLADSESVSVTSKHANDRKLAARDAQNASSKLFLCIMLRKYPMDTTAVVLAVGKAYLVTYLPEYGMEAQVFINELGDGISVKHNNNENAVTIRTGQSPAIKQETKDSGLSDNPQDSCSVPRVTLPLTVSPFDVLPVRLTSRFQSGKKPEVIASLLFTTHQPESSCAKLNEGSKRSQQPIAPSPQLAAMFEGGVRGLDCIQD